MDRAHDRKTISISFKTITDVRNRISNFRVKFDDILMQSGD